MGGRGSGKSFTLSHMEEKGLGTENQTILMRFDPGTILSKDPNEFYDEVFLKHYCELQFSWKLLSYVKDYYSLTYEFYFKDIESYLKTLSKDTDEYIKKIFYEPKTLQKELSPMEISAPILEKIRKYLSIHSLYLAMDRFDWMNSSSEYTQYLLSKYFEMFDKVILTVDDCSLNQKRKKEIKNRGFSIIINEYGKNIDVLKQMIQKRRRNKSYLNDEILTESIYQYLIEKANGNISMIFNTLKEIDDLLEWNNGILENIEEEFKSEIDIQLSKVRKLQSMDFAPPKFYL